MLVEVVCQERLQNALKLLEAHAKQVDRLDEILKHTWLEGQNVFSRKQQVANRLKDDVLHRGEVKSLNRQLDAVLYRDSQVQLLPIVVLYSKD